MTAPIGFITIRASSLGNLFDCPARWAATHIDGLRTPSNGKARLGTAVHASTAVYDQSTIDGAGMNQFKEYFLGVKKDLRRATV